MAQHAVIRIDQGRAGEYRIQIPDVATPARLTWIARTGPHGAVRVAEHTLVPPALEGRGLARELVEALVADARALSFRIVPQCSYVAAQFARHPDWADLREG